VLSVVKLNAIILNAVKLNVIMLSAIMLNAVMLSVVAPFLLISRLFGLNLLKTVTITHYSLEFVM
jgi:hypothetical protein